MPIKVDAYVCQFRCGQRVAIKKASIETHELTCFKNPLRRACKTCGWQLRGHAEDPKNPGYVKVNSECEKPDFTPPQMHGKHGVAWDCPGWLDHSAWAEQADEKEEREEQEMLSLKKVTDESEIPF
jgi:hypothetical protein